MEQSAVLQHFFAICGIPHGSGNEQALAGHIMQWAMNLGLNARQDAVGNVFVSQKDNNVSRTEGVECSVLECNASREQRGLALSACAKPTVLLQAHMDMVCEKRPGSEHDFQKDPIPYKVEGDYVTTGGETSLGADDGIGVALAMALLEEAANHPEWPRLEALFTVMEEDDLSGALNADLSDSKAQYLINLDHTADDQILCGSCGGMEVDVHIPLECRDLSAWPLEDWEVLEDCGSEFEKNCPKENVPERVDTRDRSNENDCQTNPFREKFCERPLVTVELSVSGLLGGHSGDDIDKNRGNANVFLADILETMNEEMRFTITDISGGSYRLAIPRDASCKLLVYETELNEIEAICRAKEGKFRYVLGPNGENVKVEVHRILNSEKVPSEQATTEANYMATSPEMKQKHPAGSTEVGFTPESIIEALRRLPDGVFAMNEELPGLVDASDNLGEVRILEPATLEIVLEIRAATTEQRDTIFREIQNIAEDLDGTATHCNEYPGWEFRKDSELQRICKESYQSLYNEAPTVLTMHCGLEPGCLLRQKPDLDAVSLGPNIWDLHSVSERLSISSVQKTYTYLKEVLQGLSGT